MTAIELLVQQIDDKVQQLKDHLTAGMVDDFSEYKRLCGEVRGLLLARSYTLDLKQRMENSDE
jgi:hypothetical protein